MAFGLESGSKTLFLNFAFLIQSCELVMFLQGEDAPAPAPFNWNVICVSESIEPNEISNVELYNIYHLPTYKLL